MALSLFNLFTKIINRYLLLDPTSKKRLATLAGKVITIEFLPAHYKINCFFEIDGICLKAPEAPTQTTITGTPLQFLNAAFNKKLRRQLFTEDLTITGNPELAQQIILLFDECKIDWEEPLSAIIGDIPTHHISHTFSHFKTWCKTAKETMTANIKEFIHEEAAWLPSRCELKDFFDEVDTLHLDIERLEARINLISLAKKE